jgi:hypothetical protein
VLSQVKETGRMIVLSSISHLPRNVQISSHEVSKFTGAEMDSFVFDGRTVNFGIKRLMATLDAGGEVEGGLDLIR